MAEQKSAAGAFPLTKDDWVAVIPLAIMFGLAGEYERVTASLVHDSSTLSPLAIACLMLFSLRTIPFAKVSDRSMVAVCVLGVFAALFIGRIESWLVESNVGSGGGLLGFFFNLAVGVILGWLLLTAIFWRKRPIKE